MSYIHTGKQAKREDGPREQNAQVDRQTDIQSEQTYIIHTHIHICIQADEQRETKHTIDEQIGRYTDRESDE